MVVFRITDGDTALFDVQRWLVSIQARAPNSSVVLVATMTDQVTAYPNRFPTGYLEDLENKVQFPRDPFLHIYRFGRGSL